MVTTHFMADEAEYCDRIGWCTAEINRQRHTGRFGKRSRPTMSNPDPTMEQAFIQLIHDWDKEHKAMSNPILSPASRAGSAVKETRQIVPRSE